MINYINTHTGKKPNYYFMKIIQTLISKRKQIILLKDIHMMNQIFTIKLQNTISHIMKNQTLEDNSSIVYQEINKYI
jgi:beta-lactamase class D